MIPNRLHNQTWFAHALRGAENRQHAILFLSLGSVLESEPFTTRKAETCGYR
jgi:hypothetical protein